MKIIGINGSPRKKWNTATLVERALEGATSRGAKTEIVHLYDLNYKGCISCFVCKEKGGRHYGWCAVKDALSPLYARIENADGLILGSPIYLGAVSGAMQSFLERLVFPYLTYADPPESLYPKKIRTAFLYTMGITEEQVRQFGYGERFAARERMMAFIFGSAETLMSCDTYQFDDYSKFVSSRFDPLAKLKRRQEVFPRDCQKAFEMGARLASAPEPAAVARNGPSIR